MDKTEFLETWTEKTGIAKTKLEKTYKEVEEYTRTNYPDADDETIQKIVHQDFRKAIARLQGGQTSQRKAEDFFGVILGGTRLVDINEFIRRKALKAYRQDPMEAQLQGLVDENGTPLDTREKAMGRDNPNYHKPLTSHLWNKKIYGVCVKNGSKNPMIFRMTLWRGSAKSFNYKPFVPVEFKALIKDSKNGYYELNPSKLTRFVVTQQTVDLEKWIRDATSVLSLDQLKNAYERTKGTVDAWVFVEADVDRINTEVNANTGSRSVILSDSEKGLVDIVRVFIPSEFPIGFHEYSRVIVMGQIRLWRREDDTEDRVSMEGYSIYPLPGKTVLAKPAVQPTSDSEEDNEEGGPVIEFVE